MGVRVLVRGAPQSTAVLSRAASKGGENSFPFHYYSTMEAYMCSILLQLAPGSHELSQAERGKNYRCNLNKFTK